MTYRDVKTMVQSIGLPFAYYQFTADTAVAPPFICFYFDESDDEPADNMNWAKIRTLYIELYTDEKDFELESTVETVLANNNQFYTRSETYLDSERMMMVAYEMQVVITGG
jgi:hypothetical protein